MLPTDVAIQFEALPVVEDINKTSILSGYWYSYNCTIVTMVTGMLPNIYSTRLILLLTFRCLFMCSVLTNWCDPNSRQRAPTEGRTMGQGRRGGVNGGLHKTRARSRHGVFGAELSLIERHPVRADARANLYIKCIQFIFVFVKDRHLAYYLDSLGNGPTIAACADRASNMIHTCTFVLVQTVISLFVYTPSHSTIIIIINNNNFRLDTLFMSSSAFQGFTGL